MKKAKSRRSLAVCFGPTIHGCIGLSHRLLATGMFEECHRWVSWMPQSVWDLATYVAVVSNQIPIAPHSCWCELLGHGAVHDTYNLEFCNEAEFGVQSVERAVGTLPNRTQAGWSGCATFILPTTAIQVLESPNRIPSVW